MDTNKKWPENAVDRRLICPYCMNGVSDEKLGCCGESNAHFEYVFIDENNEIIEE